MLDNMAMLAVFMKEQGCQPVDPNAPTWDEAMACEKKLLEDADQIAQNHGFNPEIKNEERVAWATVPEYKTAKELWGKSVTLIDRAYPRGGMRLRKGKLTDLGYRPSRKTTSRHRALSRAVKKYGRLSTLRKVNAVAVLTKRRPLLSKKYRADVKYLQKRYF